MEREIVHGNVTIDTSCCVQTQEEIDAILDEVKRIYIHYRKKDLEKKYSEKNSG